MCPSWVCRVPNLQGSAQHCTGRVGTGSYEVCAQQVVLDELVLFSVVFCFCICSVYRVLPRFVVQQGIGLGDTQVTNDAREVIPINPRVKHPKVARLSDIHISPRPMFNVVAFFFSSCASPHLRRRLPPQTGGIWVQSLFVSLTASCVPAATMSRGEGGLITDCSVFLPAPLGETHTVN